MQGMAQGRPPKSSTSLPPKLAGDHRAPALEAEIVKSMMGNMLPSKQELGEARGNGERSRSFCYIDRCARKVIRKSDQSRVRFQFRHQIAQAEL